jgi:hypothetical protein
LKQSFGLRGELRIGKKSTVNGRFDWKGYGINDSRLSDEIQYNFKMLHEIRIILLSFVVVTDHQRVSS